MLYSTIRLLAVAILAVLVSFGTASADIGIKGGPRFAKLSSDNLDFKTRTGTELGIFFGGNRNGVAGFQTELNWIRTKSDILVPGVGVKVDYLQIPGLLRLNAGADSAGGFRFYGVVGPAVDIKIGEEFEGLTIDDGFESADIAIVAGAGIEVARIIVEGRYEQGFRRINKESGFSFSNDEIKKKAFTILFGIRFN